MHTLTLHFPNQPPRNLGHINIPEYRWLLHQLQRPPLPALNFRGFEFGVERFHIHSRWDEPTRMEIWGREVAPSESIEIWGREVAPSESIEIWGREVAPGESIEIFPPGWVPEAEKTGFN